MWIDDEIILRRSPSEVVRPAIRLEDCLSSFAATESIERYYSTAIQDHTTAEKWVQIGLVFTVFRKVWSV
jgi:hypothetical protein